MWILQFNILVVIMEAASCCTCIQSHLQTEICSAKLVVKLTVVRQLERRNKEDFDPFLQYYVNISRVFRVQVVSSLTRFKGEITLSIQSKKAEDCFSCQFFGTFQGNITNDLLSNKFRAGINMIIVKTPGPANSCGPQYLRTGQEYLISGSMDGHFIEAGACSGVKFWDGNYTKILENVDCKCSVYTPRTWGIPTMPTPKKTDNLCIAPITSTCVFENGVCQKLKKKSPCTWRTLVECNP